MSLHGSEDAASSAGGEPLNHYFNKNDAARKSLLDRIGTIFDNHSCAIFRNNKSHRLFTKDAFTGGIWGVILQGSASDTELGVKITFVDDQHEKRPKESRAWTEFSILREVNSALLGGATGSAWMSPHVVMTANSTLCKAQDLLDTNVPELGPKLDEMHRKKFKKPLDPKRSCVVSVSEWISGGVTVQKFIQTEARNVALSKTSADDFNMKLLIVLFQVCWTLSCLYAKYPYFRHNDLHLGNVLLHCEDGLSGSSFYRIPEQNIDEHAERISRRYDASEAVLSPVKRAELANPKVFRVDHKYGVSARLWDFDWATLRPGTNPSVTNWDAHVKGNHHDLAVFEQIQGAAQRPNKLAHAQFGDRGYVPYAVDGAYQDRFAEFKGTVHHAEDFGKFFKSVINECIGLLDVHQMMYPKNTEIGAVRLHVLELAYRYQRYCDRFAIPRTPATVLHSAKPSAWYMLKHATMFDKLVDRGSVAGPDCSEYEHPQIDIPALFEAVHVPPIL